MNATRVQRLLDKHKTHLTFLSILMLGLGLRAWLVLTPGLGDEFDLGRFEEWARIIPEHGLSGFFEKTEVWDYPPLVLLILWVVSHVAALLDPAWSNEHLLRALLKTPACIADLGIGILLYVEGRRLFGSLRGTAASALYLLNPLSFYNSAYWGQIDAIHCALLLASIVLLDRRRWGWAGALLGLALLQKLQSIALAPLILLESYRGHGVRGVGRVAASSLAVAAVVCLPFASGGVLGEEWRRAYVKVIGEYPELSRNAYNLWHLVGSPGIVDTSVPIPIARAAAHGRIAFPDDASYLLLLNWRTLALAMYALCVLVILALYTLRPGTIARYGVAGLLGLTFFLIPTEMHERYALPAIACLPLWAVTSVWKERVFMLLCAMMLLNLSAVLPAGEMAAQIAGVNMAIFIALVAWLILGRSFGAPGPRDAMSDAPKTVHAAPQGERSMRWFRRLVVALLAACGAAGLAVAYLVIAAPPISEPSNTAYLSSLTPTSQQQGWGSLAVDRSVGGELLALGRTCYLRGLGTHAPSRIEYLIPDGFEAFQATVGVNRAYAGRGSVVASVTLDGRAVFQSPTLTGSSQPLTVHVPLGGARRLVLRADATPDGNRCDHVDWADARLTRD